MAILFFALIAVLIGADQLVKYWAVHSLQPKHTMDFIHIGNFKIMDLTYVENDGAIFGSMSGQRWFLIGFTSLVIIAGIVLMLRYMKTSKLLTTLIMLFVAGGIGNLIDRVRLGYVVDMFDIKLFKFAVFNVADIYVTCAEFLLLFYVIWSEVKSSKEKKAANAAAETSEKAEQNE